LQQVAVRFSIYGFHFRKISKTLHSEISELVHELEQVLDKITNYDDEDIAEAQTILQQTIANVKGH
jgi:ElaB/YqjD/DUF883 family membrane-anchored ribosome-binding protein